MISPGTHSEQLNSPESTASHLYERQHSLHEGYYLMRFRVALTSLVYKELCSSSEVALQITVSIDEREYELGGG